MKLYHNPISTCSQKVRLVLQEKGCAYENGLIDLQAGEQFEPEYVKLNPNAVVPTLDDGGQIFIESTLINEYLDDAYPEVSLRPSDAGERHRMRHFCKKIDEMHSSCGIITYAIGVRPGLLQRPKADVDALIAKIPDPVRRAVRRSVVDDGVRAPAFVGAHAAHVKVFDAVEARLSGAEWLAGDAFSLADAALLPYVLRVDHMGLDGLLRNRPALSDWFARVQARPSYAPAVSDWLPAPLVENFRKAGAAVAADVAEVLGA